MRNLNSFFKGNHGQYVIIQRPNAFLICWFIAMLISRITNGKMENIAELVAAGTLLMWATLELINGNSPFRRLLGLVIMIALLVPIIALLINLPL